MTPRKINEEISVAPQIDPAEVATLAELGFKSLICNRPDGEDFGQPDFATVAEEAGKAGLAVKFIPIVSGAMTMDDVTAFGEAMDELPKPVFAYCRSGTRSATLWALSEGQKGTPAADIIRQAASAGYDLSGLAGRLRPA